MHMWNYTYERSEKCAQKLQELVQARAKDPLMNVALKPWKEPGQILISSQLEVRNSRRNQEAKEIS